MKPKLAIGIDMGATTIKAGVVEFNSAQNKFSILSQNVIETHALKGPDSVIKQLFYVINELLHEHKYSEITGIGIGAPGIVSLDGGTVINPPNFSDWNEVNVGFLVHQKFNLDVAVENDANVAAIGEAKFGAGTNHKDFLFVIWGTGVGGGIILDGKIYHGPTGGAGEIGHITIDYNGPLCNCGNRGCIESYIGQRYLSDWTRVKLQMKPKDSPPSKIIQLVGGNLDAIEPSIISLAANQGDKFAEEILLEAGTLLGVAIASMFNALDLRVAVIGGGISAAGKFVFDAIQNSARSRVLQSIKSGITIIPAKLGNTAGMIGAACLVM
jgi:glucokinase